VCMSLITTASVLPGTFPVYTVPNVPFANGGVSKTREHTKSGKKKAGEKGSRR
jgi:hypothetical protein